MRLKVVTGLVNAAANNSSPLIVVPNTSAELNDGSVEAVGSYGPVSITTVTASDSSAA